jgi:hypothetical protein
LKKNKTKKITNKKLFLLLISFSIILFQITGVEGQLTIKQCNNEGGLWCENIQGENKCIGRNIFPTVNLPNQICVISQSQNVTLSNQYNSSISSFNSKIFTLKELDIESGVKLHFFSGTFLSAKNGVGAQGCSDSHSRTSNGYLASSFSEYSSSRGGNGGSGHIKTNWVGNTRYGGGGAAGAAGAMQGINGGSGYIYGSRALKWGSTDGCAGIGSIGGKGGGFVEIIAEKISLDGEISVSGTDGNSGNKGTQGTASGATGGQGGGPGSGGGGAGEISLIFEELQGLSGTITADGGKGGDGGEGGDGDGINRHGGGGGAGGGGAAGNIIYKFSGLNPNNFKEPTISCNPGDGGTGGIAGGEASSGNDGNEGTASSQCGNNILEWNPEQLTNLDDDTKRQMMFNYCNSGDDSDGDGLNDTADPDCYGMSNLNQAAHYMNWHSINSEYFYPKDSNDLSWFNPSASDGSDLICGDDVLTDLINSNQECTGGEVEVYQGCEAKEPLFCQQNYDGNNEPAGCVVYHPFCDDDNSQACINYEECYCVTDFDYCDNLVQSQCTNSMNQDFCQAITTPKQCSEFEAENCPAGCTIETVENNGNSNDEEFVLRDLGFITPEDGNYACFDNLRGNASSMDNSLTLPGRNYTWRYAGEYPGVFMRAFDTFFASNTEEWYYCDAMGEGLFGENSIQELEVIPTSESILNPTCAQGVSQLLGGELIIECNIHTEQNVSEGDSGCDSLVNDQNAEGFCRSIGYNVFQTYDPKEPGDFLNKCEYNCKIGEDDLYNFLQNNSDFEPLEFGGEGMSGTGLVNSIFCRNNPDLCAQGVSIHSGMSCQTMHYELNYYYPPGGPGKLCTSSQYCNAGVLVDSTDHIGLSTCCLGEYSFCEDTEGLSCADMNGETYNSDTEECLGASVNSTNGDCCLGIVVQPYLDLIGSLLSGDSFICYAHQSKNLMSECCGLIGGAEGCYNYNNPHNFAYEVLGHTYALTGATYHSVSSFDTLNNLNAYRHTSKSNDNGEFRLRSLAGSDEYTSFGGSFSIEGFDYLEFDFLTNSKHLLKDFVLEDNNGIEWSFSFDEHIQKENNRWQRIKIDLSNPPTDFDKSRVRDLLITFDEIIPVTFVIDRIFLSVNNQQTHQVKNSDTMYCTGDWGTWIDNLDGTTNAGFFQGKNPRDSNLLLSDYGPYRDACNNGMTTWWTGSACCGDDTHPTLGTGGEYWIDMQGVCWNGTAVMHDKTLALQLSTNYKERNALERGILFHGGATWICGIDEENTEFDVNFALSNNEPLGATFNDKLSQQNFVSPFTVRGNWMCDASLGWVQLRDVNRMHVLASFLLQEAQNRSPDYFTIHCGEMDSVANQGVHDSHYLGGLCALRAGKNIDFIEIKNSPDYDGNIFLGFEARNITVELSNILNETEMLGSFEILDGADINCENAPTNPQGHEFFTKCQDAPDNFEIYYNRPLKLALISGAELKETSFFGELWTAFKNFFTRLFGGGNNNQIYAPSNPITNYFDLEEFSPFDVSKDIYISKQGQKQIVGKSEIIRTGQGEQQRIRVDYTNLSQESNMKFLEGLINQKAGRNAALWSPNGATQTIYTISLPEQNKINFNQLTSFLRLTDEGAPHDFGTLQSCNNVQFMDGTRTFQSGQQIIIYETNYTEVCSAENIEIIKCYDGEILDQNNEEINTQDYYLGCTNYPTYTLQINHNYPNTKPELVSADRTNPQRGTQSHVQGTELTIIATETNNIKFKGWTLQGGIAHDANTLNIEMNQNRIITAEFGCKNSNACIEGYVCSANNNCVEPGEEDGDGVDSGDGANVCEFVSYHVSTNCVTTYNDEGIPEGCSAIIQDYYPYCNHVQTGPDAWQCVYDGSFCSADTQEDCEEVNDIHMYGPFCEWI